MVLKEDFFEGEVREGFYVDSTMKKVWAAEMELLAAVVEICERHDIKYFADWGTLLGTVRHHGYVPWDDDIDIAMLREDYTKFLAVAEKELPPPIWLRTPYTDSTFDGFHTVIWNSREISFEEEHLKSFHGCPYIVGIDIFPLDYIPRDVQEAEVWEEIYTIIGVLIDQIVREEAQAEEVEEMLKNVESVCNVAIDREKSVKMQLYRLLDAVCGLYNEDECDELTLASLLLRDRRKYRLKKDWYAKTVKMPFENMILSVPGNYDKVLKEMYGDYQKPVKGGADHDYPCYKVQEEALKRYLSELEAEGKRNEF